MKLRCPIHRDFLDGGEIAIISQLFEENYGNYAKGFHGALDFPTRGNWKWKPNVPEDNFDRVERDEHEKNGRITVVAAHDGMMTLSLHPDKERKGWGLFITDKGTSTEQWRTLYWHIELPWDSVRSVAHPYDNVADATPQPDGTFNYNISDGEISELFQLYQGKKVKAGSVIAIAGDNGYSSGPHVHFGLQRKTRPSEKAQWGDWVDIDPIEHFDDKKVIYQKYVGFSNPVRYWYRGKEVSSAEAKAIRASFTFNA